MLDEVGRIRNSTIKIVRQWLALVDLILTEHKTKMVIISTRKKIETVTTAVGCQTVTHLVHALHIKYLAVTRLSFKDLLKYLSGRVVNAYHVQHS